MQIIDMLKKDHSILRKSINELIELGAEHEIAAKVQEFTKLLATHQKIEEEALYPPLEKIAQTKELIREGIEEHHVLNVLVKELNHLNPNDKMWHAKLTVIKENLEHHLKEEETDLFPKISKNLDKHNINQITKQSIAMHA